MMNEIPYKKEMRDKAIYFLKKLWKSIILEESFFEISYAKNHCRKIVIRFKNLEEELRNEKM